MKAKILPWIIDWNKRSPRLKWKSLSNDERVIIRKAWQMRKATTPDTKGVRA